MIKVITFDLDNTLWEIRPVIERASKLLLDWMRNHAPSFADTYDGAGLEALRDEIMQDYPHLTYNLNFVRQASIKLGLLRCGYTDAQAQHLTTEGFKIYFAMRNQVKLFPATTVQLQQLKPTYKIGALTNGNADLQLVGLSEWFDFYFSAAQVKAPKPDPLMFYEALKYAQVEPHEVIHVGDDPVTDVAAATALGMHTIWVNIVPQVWPDTITPSAHVITHLQQLSQAVYSIQKSVSTA